MAQVVQTVNDQANKGEKTMKESDYTATDVYERSIVSCKEVDFWELCFEELIV